MSSTRVIEALQGSHAFHIAFKCKNPTNLSLSDKTRLEIWKIFVCFFLINFPSHYKSYSLIYFSNLEDEGLCMEVNCVDIHLIAHSYQIPVCPITFIHR